MVSEAGWKVFTEALTKQIINDRWSHRTFNMLLYTQGLQAYETATQRPHVQVRSDLFRLGVDPLEAQKRGQMIKEVNNPHEDSLNFVSMYLLNGKVAAAQHLLAEVRQEIKKAEKSHASWGWEAKMFRSSCVNLVDPAEWPGVDHVTCSSRAPGRVGQYLWYDDASRRSIVQTVQNPVQLRTLWRTQHILGDEKLKLRIQTKANTMLTKLCEATGSRPSYERLVHLVKILQKGSNALEKLKGVSRGLLVCRGDASPTDMVTGLRVLVGAGPGTQKHILSAIGRPPTVDEIMQVRSMKIVKLLYYMPWEILSRTLCDEAATQRLRGGLLPYFSKVDLTTLQQCLLPHKKRYTPPDPWPTTRVLSEKEHQVDIDAFDDDWTLVFSSLWKHFVAAKEYRKELFSLCSGDIHLAALVTLASTPNDTVHMQALGSPHPKWKQAFHYACENYHPVGTLASAWW